MTSRKSDGLIWERSDLVGDGTHPSDTGRQKVAEQLLHFFKTAGFARVSGLRQGHARAGLVFGVETE